MRGTALLLPMWIQAVRWKKQNRQRHDPRTNHQGQGLGPGDDQEESEADKGGYPKAPRPAQEVMLVPENGVIRV